jgi:hypothetical protein
MKRQAALRELIAKDPAIREVMRNVPPREAADPRWVSEYLVCVAEHDVEFRNSQAYRAAMEHAHAAQQEQAITDKISRAYHGAIAAGIVTADEANRLIQDPAALKAKLGQLQQSNPNFYWGEVGQLAAEAVFEAEAYEAEMADDADLPDPEPMPEQGDNVSVPGQSADNFAAPRNPAAPPVARNVGAEIERGMGLMKTDPKTYWSEAHQAKMSSLFEQQLAADQGDLEVSHGKLPPTSTPSNGDTSDE